MSVYIILEKEATPKGFGSSLICYVNTMGKQIGCHQSYFMSQKT